MTREGRKRLKYIEEVKNNKIEYKYLNKVLNWQSLNKLKEFLILADNRYIDKKTLMHEDKYPYFTAPINNLIRDFGGTKGTWSRNINLFVSLGLLGKVDTLKIRRKNKLFEEYSMIGKMKRARKEGISLEKVRDQNVYFIFPYDENILKEAENRAKIMCENGFSKRSFSKIFLQRVFGLGFANTVFFNDIEESEYTQAVFSKTEEVILENIAKKHFTFKDEVIKEVAKSIDSDIYKNYEENYFRRNVRSAEQIAEFEFGRSVQIICNKHELEYKMSDKYMRKMFKLRNNKKLIYDKEYYKKQKEILEVTDGYFNCNKQCKNKRK